MVQPKSTAIICGNRELVGIDGLDSDKSIKDEELASLIKSPLWKQEKVKKEKNKTEKIEKD